MNVAHLSATKISDPAAAPLIGRTANPCEGRASRPASFSDDDVYHSFEALPDRASLLTQAGVVPSSPWTVSRDIARSAAWPLVFGSASVACIVGATSEAVTRYCVREPVDFGALASVTGLGVGFGVLALIAIGEANRPDLETENIID